MSDLRSSALALLTLAGCATQLTVDPEGLRCDPGNVCPEGYVCSSGVCRSALICNGVTCQSPPSAHCVDDHTLRTYGSAGSCNVSDGSCGYSFVDAACGNGCVGGACADPSCAGVTCTTPPSSECLDASTLRSYASSGVCGKGQCQYAPSDRTCAQGCESGRCRGEDLCAGVQCTTPPPAECVGGSVRTFSPTGTCDPGTGACSYPSTDAPCSGTCVADRCVKLSFTQVGPGIRHAVIALDQAPGSQGQHALAVGKGGKVTRWDGSSWTELASGATADLKAVWMVSATSGWIVGAGGTVLRYNGASLSTLALPDSTGADLVAVHGNGASHVLIADASGRWWRYSGSSWTKGTLDTTYAPWKVASVYVSPDGTERIVGACGVVVRGCVATFGGSWSYHTDGGLNGASGFSAVGPSVDPPSDRSAFVGDDSAPIIKRHLFASGIANGNGGVPNGLQGVSVVGISAAAATSGQAVYVLTGSDGTEGGWLYRFTSAGFDPPEPLLSVWGPVQALSRSDSNGVLVSDSGTGSATVFRRGPLIDEALDVGEDWYGAAFAPNGDLYLMNVFGDLAVRSPGQARFQFHRSPTWVSMTSVAVGTAFALLVGEDGAAYRYSAGSYQELNAGTTAALRSTCRVSDTEFYAVGDSGVLLRYDGSALTPMTSPTTKDLLSVTCQGPQRAVAVGESGTVLVLSSTGWSQVPAPSTANLSAGWFGAGGALFVAGNSVFARREGNVWQQLPARPNLDHVLAVGEDVFGVSGSNSLEQYDGTGWKVVFTAPHALRGVAFTASRLVFAGLNGTVVEGK